MSEAVVGSVDNPRLRFERVDTAALKGFCDLVPLFVATVLGG